MIRTQFVAQTLAGFLLVGITAVSPGSPAYALPHFGFHSHPADPSDTRIVLDVYNKGNIFREVKIEGKVYTVLPHQSLTIKAPQGTPVFINSTGALHHKGDLLFSIDPSMKNKVLSID
jgi:hypothetical protein